MTERDDLAHLLAASGVDPALVEPLALYGQRVLAENRRFNLTGAKTAAEFAVHVTDSLTVAPYVADPLVDVGSGAGLPAIPVALATGVSVTLIETTLKKARFLEELMGELGLQGRVIAQRAEVAGHEPALREHFASATARAVSSAPTVVELLLPLLAVGGVAVLQRGHLDRAERDALGDAAMMLGGVVEREIRLTGERRIIVVRKERPTPPRFPRRTGVPEKRPLCVTGSAGRPDGGAAPHRG